MSTNMSTLDRGLRGFLVAPAAAVAGVLVGPGGIASIVLYAVAAIMLATAVAGVCPLYRLVRIDTRGRAPLPH